MLKQRIITALILAPLALIAILFLPVWWFEVAIAGVIGLGGYEWANMSGIKARPRKAMFAAFVFALCLVLSSLVNASDIWYQGQLHGLYHFILGISVIWWLFSASFLASSAFSAHSLALAAVMVLVFPFMVKLLR